MFEFFFIALFMTMICYKNVFSFIKVYDSSIFNFKELFWKN